MRECVALNMRQYLIFGYQYLILGDGCHKKRFELLCFKQFCHQHCHILKKCSYTFGLDVA
jgi:hypothetical protein